MATAVWPHPFAKMNTIIEIGGKSFLTLVKPTLEDIYVQINTHSP